MRTTISVCTEMLYVTCSQLMSHHFFKKERKKKKQMSIYIKSTKKSFHHTLYYLFNIIRISKWCLTGSISYANL